MSAKTRWPLYPRPAVQHFYIGLAAGRLLQVDGASDSRASAGADTAALNLLASGRQPTTDPTSFLNTRGPFFFSTPVFR
jgi:hypothetical protein